MKLPAASGSVRWPSAKCCAGWAGKNLATAGGPVAPGRGGACEPETCPFYVCAGLRNWSIIEQGANPNLSAFCSATQESPGLSQDADPSHRGADRLLARLGLLEDAPPLFGSATAIPRAGVLLALPVLVASGVFDCAKNIYGNLGPAFYGLRTSLLTLLLMALWRIKRPEGLKEYSPQDLGRVLGLDRAPEVKTLRRKLARLAAAGRAAQFGQALAQQRVAAHGAALGFLYTDGHVRVYHGQHALPKAHVARMRISLPATSDYWVNDSVGDPLFVVTAEANAGLVKMLPGILGQVRALVGKRRLTVVFDRGGYSPKLFQQILVARFDLLTYRKGRYPRIPHRFHEPPHPSGGTDLIYVLADQEVRLLKGKLRLRQVTRLMDNGHQTPILTSRRDLPAAQVAYRMFDRWRQENFFKYLREEYALDALVEYAAVPDDPTREVPNPAWAAVDAQLRQAQAHLDRLQAEYGLEALTNLEQTAPDHARVQNRARKAGPENLECLAARPATGETSRRRAPPSSGPSRDRRTGGQTGAGTKAPDQLDQDGGLSGRERSAPVSRASLPESRRGRSDSPSSGFGQRGGSGSHANGVARHPGGAKFAAPHACHRGASARNSTRQKPFFPAPVCASTTPFGRLPEAKSGHFT